MYNYNKCNCYRIKEKKYVSNCDFPKNHNYCKESSLPQSDCCCKTELKKLLQIISKPPLNSYVDFTKFTLYTMSTSTSQDATTINNLSFCCDNSLINYTDSTDFNTTSLCNLTAVSFQLINPAINLPLFSQCLRKIISPSIVKNPCCTEKDTDCCCDSSKASLLASSLGSVNLYVSGALGSLLNATVLAVTDNVAILTQTASSGSPSVPTTKIYFICLSNIELLG